MKKNTIRKLKAFGASLLLVIQMFAPLAALFPSRVPVHAQEATDSSTVIVTPTETPTPEPTPTETIAPSPTETPTPTPEPTETVTPTPTIDPTPTTTEPPKETGPPEIGQILDGVSTTATPASTDASQGGPTPTPTVTAEQPEHGQLNAVILKNVEAVSLNLDSVDPSASAQLTTDKADYAPTDTALISGSGLTPNTTYSLTVSSSDDPATTTTVEVKTDVDGTFVYAYQLDGTYRPNYKVELKNSEGAVVAQTTFTDAAKTASVSGNWNYTATWGGSAVPTSADDVTINPGITVTVTAAAAANSIIFANSGTATGILTVNTGVSLVVTNGITLRNAAGANTSATLAGAGTINAASVTVGGTTTPTGGTDTTTLNSTISTLSLSGNLSLVGLDSGANDNNVVFNLKSGSISVGGSVVLNEPTDSSVTLTLANGAQTGTLTLSGATPFTFTGTGSPTFTANGTSATVVYSGAAQTVWATTYSNLTLSGSGAKTITGVTVDGNLTLSGTATATTPAAMTIDGNLNVGAGTIFATGATNTWDLTVSGTTSVSGILTLANTDIKTFTGNVTINSGGIWNETGVAAINYAGNLQNDGTYTANTGVHTFSGTAKTISGANAVSIPNLTISGTTANNGTLTVSTALAGGSTLTNSASGTLNYGGSGAIAPTLTATAAGNTVNYNGAAQTVKDVAYSNLTLSGSGTKTWTLAGTRVVGGILTVSSGAGLTTAGNQTLGITGATNVTGTLTLGGTSAKTFTGNATVNSGGTWNETGVAAINYAGNLQNDGTYTTNTGVHTFSGTGKTISGTNAVVIPSLTISGTTTNNGTLTVSTTLAGASTLTNGASGTLNYGGSGAIAPTLTATAVGNTVNYTGAAQTVKATSYNNLSTSGSNAKTLGGAVTVNGDLNIGSGTILDVSASNFGITLKGNWTNNGTFTQRSGTVTMNGASGTQTMSGSTFNNLTINNADGVSLLTDETVNGTLTFTSGNVTTGAFTMIANGTVTHTNGHVIGNLRKNVATGATSQTFEVGATNYNPVTVAFGNVATSGNLTAKATAGQHSNIGTSNIISTKDVNVYWTLTNSGIVFDTYNATFNFVSGDILGSANTATFAVGKYNSSWTYPTVGTKTSTTTQTTGITTFSDFVIGETNFPPSFGAIADQAVNENSSSQDVAITNVSPGPSGESSQTVTMSATSSDPTIVPNPSVSGAGSTRTLTYTPAPNKFGVVTITVTADDGQSENNTYSRTFTIAVNEVDTTPPTDPADVASTDHDTNTPSSDNTITMLWTVAGSAPGATDSESGVDGYSYEFSNSSSTTPNAIKNAEESATGTTPSSFALADGSWYFHLRTRDNAGNWTSTVHVGPFVIDTTDPETAINTGPSGLVAVNDATFEFSADETATFECQLDGGGFSACTSSKTYSDLADGEHTFDVRAKDTAGNTDPTPDSQSWTIDTTAPTTTIGEVTDGNGAVVNADAFTKSSSISIPFTTDDGSGSGVTGSECKLDDGSYEACSTPFTASGLSDGSHTVNIRSTDNAGNVESTATFTWNVDTLAPVDPTPVSTSHTLSEWDNDRTIAVTWSGADDGSGSGVDGFYTEWNTSETTMTGPVVKEYEETTSSEISPNRSTGQNHYFHIATVDNAGNWTSTAHLGPFWIDAANPTGSWVTPLSGGYLSGIANLEVSAGDVGSGVQQVTFRIRPTGGSYSNISIDTTSPYQGILDTTTKTDETYDLRGLVRDNSGRNNANANAVISVTIDNTLPALFYDDDVVTGPVQSDTVVISASDTNADTSSYEYGFSPDSICDASDTFGNVFTSGSGFTFSDESQNGNWLCVRAADLAGNVSYLGSANPLNIDITPPQVISAETQDRNSNGQIDAIKLTFNENINDDLLDLDNGGDGWDVADPAGAEQIGSGETENDNVLILTFGEGPTPDTANTPTVTYTPSGGPRSTHDLAGNELEAYEGTPEDKALPVLLSAETQDTDLNGKIDAIKLTFSEDVDDARLAAGTADGWDVDGYGDESIGTGDTANDTILVLAFTEGPVVDTGATPTVTYTPSREDNSTHDLAGNQLAPYSAAATDTAGPTTPVATPEAGDYTSDQSVTLASSDDGGTGLASIYYTTDGSTPDNTKTEYTGTAITVDKDMTIKAIAYDNAGNPSDVLTAVYGIAPVISAEASSSVTSTSTTVTWTTDDPATSRVIYDTVPHAVLGTAPNYGYASSTIEADTAPMVTSHSVSISGLTAGTTYYYRTVSHGSPESVSSEKTVTTSAASSDSGGGGGTSSSSGGGGGGDGSPGTAPVCSDTKPANAPTLLSATGGVNSVTLTWSAAGNPLTYYLVTYGASAGAQTYGNPNVGGAGTTSYTITNLSGGTTYYFRVRGGNGCAPGDYSNELSSTPAGGFVTGPAAGFAPGVLGVTTEEEASVTLSATPTETTEEEGEVLGTQQGWNLVWFLSRLFSGLGGLSLASIFMFLGY